MRKAGAKSPQFRKCGLRSSVFFGPRLCWIGDACGVAPRQAFNLRAKNPTFVQNENADRFCMESSDDPTSAAHSRVTNAGRFAPLHDVASELLDRLEKEFDVVREEAYGLDPELETRYELARPCVRLVPKTAAAAPVVLAFSKFPGVYVRLGRWCTAAFPACGCDACSEVVEIEAERLRSLIDDAIAGRFREAIRVPDSGPAWSEWEVWSDTERCRSSSMLDRDDARRMLGDGELASYEWLPWPRRP
jgi:hypothetical protein